MKLSGKRPFFGVTAVTWQIRLTTDGWYMYLIRGKDESPAIIADVHTNPNNDPGSALYPPCVLHVGTGPAAALFMIVDTGEGPALHVGPAFAYY